ncbi:FAD synthetase family protein [Metabacillus sediminilitoris]|nr:FAD synthetase family protein [Metabacillus sediminilitoris]
METLYHSLKDNIRTLVNLKNWGEEKMEVVNLDHPIDLTVSLNSEPCVMALGFFDGVHKGHRKIIETAKEIAKKEKIKFTVMTFFPHPSNVISKTKKIDHYITPLPVKKEIFKCLGVEKLFIVNFNTDFSEFSHQQFVEQYIVGLKCQHVVAGFDFTYGYKGQGNMDQMVSDSNGRFDVTTVSKLEHNHEKISSSAIREMLITGEVQKIPMYLEDYYSIKGKVIRNYHINHNENVLTIKIDHSYHLPKKGLYKITAELDNSIFDGTFYVPLHNTGTIEVHLLNSHINYDEGNITMYFIEQEFGNSQIEEYENMFIVI